MTLTNERPPAEAAPLEDDFVNADIGCFNLGTRDQGSEGVIYDGKTTTYINANTFVDRLRALEQIHVPQPIQLAMSAIGEAMRWLGTSKN
jgi:hypothetical protein